MKEYNTSSLDFLIQTFIVHTHMHTNERTESGEQVSRAAAARLLCICIENILRFTFNMKMVPRSIDLV